MYIIYRIHPGQVFDDKRFRNTRNFYCRLHIRLGRFCWMSGAEHGTVVAPESVRVYIAQSVCAVQMLNGPIYELLINNANNK